ncbi:FAD-dependent monooxygenase [Mesorhizobium sp. IMUNJ 23033]|uniref:FAD-dependent monooxygenase n=1 Tax=Mesorhizobium sp. IMUNJ 23033 TaxID=3378039 RepID=UPI00384D155E
MSASQTQVLIAGAGPTGLTLALWLTRLGVQVRIFDKDAGPGETSRALAVQARTLEFHRQIGIVDDILAAGVRVEQLTVRTPAGVAARLPLSDFGQGVSPYSFAFALPQDIHERILITHLERAGVRVERNTELVAFEDTGGTVVATLNKQGATETVGAAYLVGCDGARSAVRHGLAIGFPGGTYEQSFYVADVDGSGAVTPNGMDTTVSAYGFAIVMPVRQSGSLRLIGVVPKAHEANETITFEAIRADVERDTGIAVDKVNWFSTYRVHHRVAERFRIGRVFLAGDAGHIHSPAGGQGMNTGMGDAVNLAWKLAAVLQGRADKRLLDSYEPERIAFARLLIDSTDKVFRVATSRSRLVGLFRRYLMPKILRVVLGTAAGSRAFFGMISQTRIQYRASAISSGKAGAIHGGDRLPYVATASGDNFESLHLLDWQVHVYGEANAAFQAMLAATGIPVHVFAWSDRAKVAGLQCDGAYLVRPDGHVALAAGTQDPQAFERYVAALAIKPRQVAASRSKNLRMLSAA